MTDDNTTDHIVKMIADGNRLLSMLHEFATTEKLSVFELTEMLANIFPCLCKSMGMTQDAFTENLARMMETYDD